MCQNNYNRKKEEKKYKHLNYVEKTCIYVNDVIQILSNSMIEFVSYLCFF